MTSPSLGLYSISDVGALSVAEPISHLKDTVADGGRLVSISEYAWMSEGWPCVGDKIRVLSEIGVWLFGVLNVLCRTMKGGGEYD